MSEPSGRRPARMEAVIIASGSELTRGRVHDSNSTWLARRLSGSGFDVITALTVPDDPARLAEVLVETLRREPGIIVVTGGLGPTRDDLTAAAVAAALGVQLELNQEALAAMGRLIGFATAEEHHRKQATMPAGARMLTPVGTAPGFLSGRGETLVVALPGVPSEMAAMWDEVTATPEYASAAAMASPEMERTLCLYGQGEPPVDTVLAELLNDHPLITASICSRYGEVTVALDFPPEAEDDAEGIINGMRDRFQDYYYSDGKTIEAVVVESLAAAGKTLAAAESCTGGLFSAAITGVSGASAVFRGGIVAYDNDVKTSQLGVRQEILEAAGAVSEPVAQWMAVGARSRLGADFGIGITGIAGPTGGTEEKPVGLVFICASSPGGDQVRGFNFSGDRDEVRRAAVISALHMIFSLVKENRKV